MTGSIARIDDKLSFPRYQGIVHVRVIGEDQDAVGCSQLLAAQWFAVAGDAVLLELGDMPVAIDHARVAFQQELHHFQGW